MAGNSVIGALRVSLGIDSASFEAGLKNAQKGLSKWQVVALGAFAAVATAGVAAGIALEKAMGSAINRFDDMGKAAQKVGVSVEALSRLEYAAKLSDVSLEQLTGGLQRLSKGMADVASGSTGPAASAFEALGISVTNAAGQLRDSDVVFAEVADRFARMEDGSTKTALAIGIFGKAGADLIPLLNEGRDGLAALADESDRFGQTISQNAAANAEAFNDNLTRVQAGMEGVTNVITSAALPVLTYLSDKFVQAASDGDLLQSFAEGFIVVMKSVVSVAAVVATAIGSIIEALSTLLRAMRAVQTDGFDAALAVLGAGFGTIQEDIAATTEFVNGLWAAVNAGPKGWGAQLPFGGGSEGAETEGGGTFATPVFGPSTAELESRLEALRQSLMTEEQLEMDSHLKRLAEIKSFYEQGAIAKSEQDSLIEAAHQQHADKMAEITKKQVEEETRLREQMIGNVAGIFGSLSTIAESFGEKGLAAAKAFGVAEAIINTAQGITKALAQGGIFGFVGAAAVAAAGAAQISTILSATKGSTSKPSVKGGSAATSAPAVNNPVATDAGTTINLTLKGGGRYSRNEIEQLFRDMQAGLDDGMKLNVVGA